MGPAQGAFGVEREHGLGLEQTQFLERLVVVGGLLAGHPDLQGHVALRLGFGVDVAGLGPFGVAGLQHVEVLGPGEGQAVVEALLHQIHEVAGRQRGGGAIQLETHLPLARLHGHRGGAAQAGGGGRGAAERFARLIGGAGHQAEGSDHQQHCQDQLQAQAGKVP
jgi:hypothetical protein